MLVLCMDLYKQAETTLLYWKTIFYKEMLSIKYDLIAMSKESSCLLLTRRYELMFSSMTKYLRPGSLLKILICFAF